MKTSELLNNYNISKTGIVTNKTTGKVLKPCLSTSYPRVVLSKNGYKKRFSVHRLVAIKYIPNPDNKPCVNHMNGIKNDNRVENLEWVTYQENEIHSFKVLGKTIVHTKEAKLKMSKAAKGRDMSTAITASAKKRKGLPSHNRRSVILNGKHKYESLTSASKKTGISITSISNNLSGLSKKTKIGIWRYVV